MTIKELEVKVDNLQIALDAEQAEIAARDAQKDAAILGLQEANAALQLLVADGGTTEERQAIADKIDAVITDLQSTVVVEPPVDPVVEG